MGEDLVPKILSVTGNGQSVEFLTTDKVLVKFYEKFIEGKKLILTLTLSLSRDR